MGLIKSDLTRNFGIGFLLGAVLVGAMTAEDWKAEFSQEAYAATTEVVAAGE